LHSLPATGEKLFSPRPLQEALDAFKKSFVYRVLEQTGGNQTKAAQILKIHRSYLNQLLRKFSE